MLNKGTPMKLEVEVISRETIKPSSPTPHHLHHYQLSFLDQISPPVYNPLILFYPVNNNNNEFYILEKYNHLKQSLSQVLTHFYPLAGRIKDNSSIECKDEGIPFFKAQVKSQLLSDVIKNPVPAELNKLLPFALDDDQELPLGVQLNVFECGGIAISACVSHKIGDALSLFAFLKSWAATARGESDTVCTKFVSAKLFPPKNISGFKPNTGITKENIVTKRFVFSASKIESIREKCASNLGNKKPPSRVEALSAFIWSRFVATNKKESMTTSERFYALVHAVNLRPRIEPPLPEYSFGNLFRIAITIPRIDSTAEEEEGCNYGHVVRQIRDSIDMIDNEYVRKLQEGNEHLDFIRKSAERFVTGEMVTFNFTSLCRFPLYEADFGWGKPIWVGSASLTFKNLVVFMDTVSGDGVEAWISVKEEDMAMFEADEELLAAVAS